MASLAVDYSALSYPLRSQDGEVDVELEQLHKSRSGSNPQIVQVGALLITRDRAPSDSSPKQSLVSSKNVDAQSLVAQNGLLRSISQRRRRLQGWRMGVATSASLATTILLTNVIFAIWGSVARELSEGNGDLYVGDCDLVNTQNMGLHVLINALSSILLSASNYTMQCLSAPTRKECDKAHAQGDWLDIGVPGVRNLTRIGWPRRVSWVLLAVSSIPIHLLYNSAIFKTLEANSPVFVLANEEYLLGQNVSIENTFMTSPNGTLMPASDSNPFTWAFNDSLAEEVQHAYVSDPSLFDRLSVLDCMSTYGVYFLSGHSDLILITHEAGQNFSYNVFFAGERPTDDYGWICRSGDPSPTHCDVSAMETTADDWRPIQNKKVDYCLAQRRERNCKLQFSIHILVAVILCNVIKTGVMVWILFCQREQTLVTFGDAIASWLDDPDDFTKGRCLAERPNAQPGQHGWLFRRHDHDLLGQDTRTQSIPEPAMFNRAPIRRWHNAVSIRRWVVTLTLCTGAISAAGALLSIAIQGARQYNIPNPITTLGFGNINPNAMVDLNLPDTDTQGFISSVLLANLPQVVLSFIYLMYNGLFTCMHLAHEYTGYGIHRKALRVTAPRGQQRSTYWLQLPYTYGLPLIIASGILHWLCSQSLFLARILYRANALGEPDKTVSAVGYSCAPILCIMVLGSCMIVFAVLMGFRKLQSHMPLARSCSAMIAAAAHRPAKDADAAILPVKWGVVAESGDGDGGVGHCSFTSEEVTGLQEGKLYAGITAFER